MGILDDAIREHLELKRRHGADSQEVSRQEREILGADDASAPEIAYDEPADAEPQSYAEPQPTIVDEPLSGSPLAEAQVAPPAVPAVPAVPDIFPGTSELEAAASRPAPAAPAPAPATPAGASALRPPAPADADSETAARSGARRLSDDELAAWRRRLSERADRLAAQRPGTGAAAPATAAGAAAAPAPTPAPAKTEPPAYWSGNTSSSDSGTPPKLDKPAPAPIVEPTAPGVPADFFDAGEAATAFAPEPAPEPVAETPDHDALEDTPDFLEETPEHDRMWFEQKPPRDFDFG